MRMANKKPLHVVILPYSAQGTLIPALMLAHKLAAVGFDVSYVILEHRVQHLKNQAMIRGCHQRIRFTCLKPKEEPPVDIHQNCTVGHDSFDLVGWLRSHGDAERDELVKLLKSFKSSEEEEDGEDVSLPGPPACIISAGMKSWTQDVANELRIPRLVLFPGSVEALLMDLYIKVLHPQGRIPIRSSLCKEKHVTPDELEPLRLPGGMPPIHPDDINSVLQDCCPKTVSDFYVGNALRHHEAAGILCNSFMELEPGACSAMQNSEINPNSVPFQPVGPLLADSGGDAAPYRNPDNKECLEWLDKQLTSSVLYVSFGSLARPSAEQVGELAFGLEASNQPFLWVLRPPEDESSSLLPQGFLSRVRDRCLVTDKFAPQLAVLSHRATAGFLTHSGWNSTLESVSLGVPMICLPFFADQRANCRMVVDRLKLGIELRKDGNGVVRKEEIQRAVKALMDSEEGEAIKIKAQEFRRLATQAFESCHSKLKSFIESKCSV